MVSYRKQRIRSVCHIHTCRQTFKSCVCWPRWSFHHNIWPLSTLLILHLQNPESEAMFFLRKRLFATSKNMFAKQQEQKHNPFQCWVPTTAEQRPRMQFTTAIEMTLKGCFRLVAWRAHRWSVFPAGRQREAASLMPWTFHVLNTLCRCVQFHLVGLIIWVWRHMLVRICAYGGVMCAWVRGNEKKTINCVLNLGR